MTTNIFKLYMALILISANIYGQSGSLDINFNTNYFTSSQVRGSAFQSSGKIIIGGDFSTNISPYTYNILRLNTDGERDTMFVPKEGPNSQIYAVAVQSDDKILIAGDFTAYDSIPRNHIARLNPDGTLDTTFNTVYGANYDVWTISVQDDGKIIIGGDFTNYNGFPISKIARLNSDGTLDPNFQVGTGFDASVFTSSIQNDGKILIGGEFGSFNGISRKGIARLNINGSLDTSFDPQSGAEEEVYTISIQNDGKIIIGGSFITFNGTAINYLARLNNDGSIDQTFNTGPDSWIFATKIQNDGKIIIGGFLTEYNSIVTKKIARINSDGSLDTTFNSGSGANATIYTISIQTDNKIIIGGGFNNNNGISRPKIARLNNSISLGTNESNSVQDHIKISPNPSEGIFNLKNDKLNRSVINIFNSAGQLIKQENTMNYNSVKLDISDQPNGLYFIEVIQNSKSDRFKISKQ